MEVEVEGLVVLAVAESGERSLEGILLVLEGIDLLFAISLLIDEDCDMTEKRIEERELKLAQRFDGI